MKKRRKSIILKPSEHEETEQVIREYVICPIYKHYKGLEICYFKCKSFKRCKRIHDLYVANGYVIAPIKEKDGQTRPKARNKGGATVPEQAGEVSGHTDIEKHVHQSGDAEDV